MVQALKSFPRIANFLRDARGRILHRADTDIPKVTIGSSYGSHTIPAASLNARSVVYSFGIGTDISFDNGLIELAGCNIHAFDPTPRSIAWISQQDADENLIFHGFGLAEKDGSIAFQQPGQASHVSYSRAIGAKGAQPLPVKRLGTIMRELGHDHVDLLKLDIEGFEYAVIEDMLANEIHPGCIAVEFHHGMYGFDDQQTKAAVNALSNAGYGLFHVSGTGREYSLIFNP
jgi:FkbM family methyltransferase